jgi:transposase
MAQTRGGAARLKLTLLERAELVRRASSRRRRAEARRARLLLLLAGGASWEDAIRSLGCSRSFVARWVGRFRAGRLAGMHPRHRGGIARVLGSDLEARIVRAALAKGPGGAPRWTTRTLGRHLGVSHMTIQRVWEGSGLRPGRHVTTN